MARKGQYPSTPRSLRGHKIKPQVSPYPVFALKESVDMKKIALLTLPPKENYGGILQCYALQSFLQELGNSVELIDLGKRNRSLAKEAIKFILTRTPGQNIDNYRSKFVREKVLAPFIDSMFSSRSPPLRGDDELSEYFHKMGFDYIIVGSDQVWRYKYGKEYFPNFFLNFRVPRGTKKLAFSASFGLPYWEKPSLNGQVSKYLSDFQFISVRELDGARICKETFGVNGVRHTVDPTLLHDDSFYRSVCKNVPRKNIKLAYYVLDQNDAVVRLLRWISDNLKLKDTDLKEFGYHHSAFVKDDTVEEWLAHFRDADYIVTDSFHGMVFSIIFRKPFYVLINNARGSSRFFSLLEYLDLMGRTVDPFEPTGKLCLDDIDYAVVDSKLNTLVENTKSQFESALA
jgi:hypothetical protein